MRCRISSRTRRKTFSRSSSEPVAAEGSSKLQRFWSAAANEPARALFQHLGFRETMVEMTMELP
jgi:hypothetical protein